ncbi:GAF and ANTAR domain-containing protein [Rhodococcus sp. G-MC3]|uniref:GAF and ANTAR domain-containing protein n=1 Tax=Rhodococcus sp. G-MC3 TaxID=3046209 RepID=UPI0024B9C477|nr:GAF and ANTAR domain-containing protein [Rhodococcus sp. G-MC3]MDJ0392908.1 GAF and ANTAR domain-containing protein [Rhodococcus sp. G-MC3]
MSRSSERAIGRGSMGSTPSGDPAFGPHAHSGSESTPGGVSSSGDAITRLTASLVRAAGVTGAAVTLLSSGGARELLYATDEVAQDISELQFTSGVGPCIDAFESGSSVCDADLSSEAHASMWFGFRQEALELGVRALWAFPLSGGPIGFGVLELYRASAGDLTTTQNHAALDGARHIAAALLTGAFTPPITTPADSVDSDDFNPFTRPQINHAAGMISVQLVVGIGEAMSRLRAHAYAERRSIVDVADDVVSRRLRFDGHSAGD